MTIVQTPLTLKPGRPRRVEPEWLDVLPAYDPRAERSRLDLQRLNRWLGSSAILLDALDHIVDVDAPLRLVELGTGDGSLMLGLAQQRAARWGSVQLSVVDRHPLLSSETLASFRALGWRVQVIEADVFHWLAQAESASPTIVLANLFVHHFNGMALTRLLSELARSAQAFVCCEPRRSTFALTGSRLLGAMGCNAVTRHDAVLSVHAGFRDQELSALWPVASSADPTWRLSESAAGLFSHRFVAQRCAV